LSSLSDTDDFGHTLKWHRNYECKLLKDVGFKAEDSLYKTRATASTEVPLLLVQVRTQNTKSRYFVPSERKISHENEHFKDLVKISNKKAFEFD
jgi:hypothetical protein